MADGTWHQRFTLRRILGRLQREMDSILKRNQIIFFRCGPIEGDEPLRGTLVEADLARYEQWRRTESDFPWPAPEEGPRRFSEGHRLFTLASEGQARCYGWVSVMRTFWLDELNADCSTDVPMTWIWNCVTPAAMRNQGYYTEFLRALRRKFRDRDLLIYCHSRNAPSYRAIRRAGFQPWVTVTRNPTGTRIGVLQPEFGGKLHAAVQTQKP